MATINGSFTGIASSKIYPFISYSYSQNVSGNYTDITMSLYFKKISSQYYGHNTSTHSNTSNIDGNTNYSADSDFNLPAGETGDYLIRTVIQRVYHNSDGTKNCWLGWSGNTNIEWGTYNFGATIALPTIPREAYITNSVDFTLGNNIPLTLSNAGNRYVQSLLYVNGALIKTTNHGKVTSATITPTSGEVDSMYAQIPSATSCAMYVRIKTFSDSGYTTQIGGNKDKAGTMSINQAINRPIFSDFVVANLDKNIVNTDKYSNVLVTSSTSTLLGSNDKVIKGYSKLRATISVANKMVALNSATAVKYRFTAGSLVKDENYSADSNVNIDIDNVLTKDVSVAAYDSRNLTTSVSKSLSYLAEYTPVSLWGLTFVRDNGIDSETKLQVNGNFWKHYFGGGTSGILNSITAHYRYKLTTESWGSQTWTAITLTDDGDGNLSYDDYINGDLGASGFTVTSSFDIEVRLYDKLSQTIINGTIPVGTPVIDITQSGIAIKSKYDDAIGGALQVNGVNVMALTNGWIPVDETWTRTGDYTFTVTGDLTAKYRKGTYVRYKDGGNYEYGVVINSSYSSPNTTVTLATNTNYAMANTTITDTAISYILNPEGFPQWFSYTPTYSASGSMTYTSVTTNLFKFRIQGKMCTIKFNFTGTTGGKASNQLKFSLPVSNADASGSSGDLAPSLVRISDGTYQVAYIYAESANNHSLVKIDNSNFTLGASRGGAGTFNYRIS